MRFSTSLFVFALSLYSSHAFAHVLNSEQSLEFVNDLGEQLSIEVHETERPISVYHYGKRGAFQRKSGTPGELEKQKWGTLNMPRLGNGVTDLTDPKAELNPVELSPPEMNAYFKQKAGLAFGEGTADGAAGPGLYAAIDPIQSESYAGAPWFLLEIEMPAHIRYVNFVDGIFVSRSFFDKWLKDFDWPALDSDRKSYTVISKDRILINKESLYLIPELRKLWVRTLKSLHIEMMAYNWEPYGIKYCKFKNVMGPGSQIAFVFVNPGFVDRSDVKFNVYVANLETNPAPEKAAHYKKIAEISELGKIQIYDNYTEQAGVTYNPDEAFRLTPNKVLQSLSNYSSLFLRIQGWNQALGMKNTIADQLFFKSDATSFSSWINDWSISKNLVSNTSLEAKLNRALFKTIEQAYPSAYSNSSYVSHSYTFQLDLSNLVKSTYGSAELARREHMIETQTFGCDPNHTEENIYEQMFH